MIRRGWVGVALVGSLACAGAGGAQEVRFRSETGNAPQRQLERFLARGGYRIWTRDTVVERADTVAGDVLILEAAARIAGRVRGDVYVVDGDLFLRPGAVLEGDVVVLGGGFYRSSRAEVEGRLVYEPNEVLRVVPEAGGYRIYAVRERERAFRLRGLYGLGAPTYQRVDGWTFGWGGRARAVGFPGRPEIGGELRLKTTGGDFEGDLWHAWHPAPGLRVGVEGGRITRSRDAWIRGDLPNTASFLFLGNDYRNYYRADFARAFVEAGGELGWRARFAGGWEEARSLVARDRTILFAGDSVRANPPVDQGDVFSAEGIVDYLVRRGPIRRALHLHLEGATEDVAGDFSFLFGEAQLFGRQPVTGGHTIEAMAIARGDLAGRLPRQRWSALGGVGTLPTFPILQLRGERMFLGEITWLIEVPPLEIPSVGPTEILFRAAIGSAWSEGESLVAEKNLMLGLRILFLEAVLAADPSRSDLDLQFFVAGRWPRSLRGF